MKFNFIVNKETCFYYWVQSISEWNVYAPELEAYEYYKSESGVFSPDQLQAIDKIRDILLTAKHPRLALARLYSDRIDSSETSIAIDSYSHILKPNFERLWPRIDSDLLQQQGYLTRIDFAWLGQTLKQIIEFLDSNFELKEQDVYLLQNSPGGMSVGHQIEGTDFILLHPSMRGQTDNERTTIGTLLHELIHRVEFQSCITSDLTQKSYNRIVTASGKSAPAGVTWKMLYREIIVYCFINNITGGYLRTQVFNKPKPSIESMKEGYSIRRKSNTLKTSDLIAWIALNIQEDIEEYLKQGKVFDTRLADKISRLILKNF